jgi:sporulation protein YlmC with PRC-barrel domain
MNKAVFFAAALLLTPLPALGEQTQQSQSQDQSQNAASEPQGALSRESRESEQGERSAREDLLERLSQSDLRDRLSSAVERIRNSCGEDIDRFCGDITPGSGRVASCVQAYSDQLSMRCQLTLRRTANRIEQAVQTIADTCMSAVEQQCGDADDVRQCVQQKSSALPQSCQTVVAAVSAAREAVASREQQGQPQQSATAQGTTQQGQQGGAGQAMAQLKGLPVFSSDGKNLGQVVQVERTADGKIQSIQIQVGRLLGLGEKTITIDGSKIEQLGDRIRAMMSADQIRQIPESRNSQR